jgi:O-antigen/teichoic acid export membrane protein
VVRPARRIPRAISKSLGSKGVLSLIDQAAVSGANFAASVIIARMCSPEELGVYYLAFTIVLVLRAAQANMVSIPYTIYCNRRKGAALASYGASTVVHHAVLSLLTVAGLLCLIGILSLGVGPPSLSPAVWGLLGAMPFLLLREFIRHFTLAHLRLIRTIAIDVAVAVFQLGGMLLLAQFEMLTVQTVYLAMGGACAAACLGSILANDQPLHFRPGRVIVDWLHNWAFGKWALASQLVSSASLLLFPWILLVAHGEASTGVLAACTALVGFARLFVYGVRNVVTPRSAQALAHGGVAELRRVLQQTALMFLVTIGAFCLLILFGGDLLGVFVYGQEYAGTGSIAAVLAFSILAESLGIVANSGLWALERPSLTFASDLAGLGLGLTAACLIIPWGVLGAAVATLLGMSAGATVRWIALWRLMRFPSWQAAVA